MFPDLLFITIIINDICPGTNLLTFSESSIIEETGEVKYGKDLSCRRMFLGC